MAVPNWSDLSPSAMEDNSSRYHPDLWELEPRGRMEPDPPLAPSLGPATSPQHPPDELCLPAAVHTDPTNHTDTWTLPRQSDVVMPSGPSPRLLWVLYCTWRLFWGSLVGIPPPLQGLLGLYLHTYLFDEVPFAFLLHLQQLLTWWLPGDAQWPRWLWRLVFSDVFHQGQEEPGRAAGPGSESTDMSEIDQ